MKFALDLLLSTSLLLSKIEATKISKCSDCTVFTTGKDGSLWGWEDGTFCKISSSCSKSKNTSTKKTTTVYKKSTKKTANKKTSSTTTKAKAKETTTTTTSAPAAHETDAKGNIVCNGCVVTGTGGDNSLWGWEDEKSCIINNTKCEGKLDEKKAEASAVVSNHKKDASGNVICNKCEVTATGGDGSYWGWEDQASCIIDNTKCNLTPPKSEQKALERGPDGVLICSTCEYTRIDPDTTTWNTENGEDCRVIGSRCGINTTPHPWCSGCVVTGTGNDGALYGWENNASCLINEVTCGIVSNHGEYGEASSSNSQQKMTFLNYAICSLAALYVYRRF
jgi:hypothetical protein